MKVGESLYKLDMALQTIPTCTGGKKKREKWQLLCVMAAKSTAGHLAAWQHG